VLPRAARSLWFLSLLCAAPALAGEPYLVKDINPMLMSGGSRPENFHALGNTAVFWARTAETGRELWGSDGTTGGTFLLHESCPGNCSGSPQTFYTPTPRGHFFFGQGGLWVTRGTPVSTFRLTEGVSFPFSVPDRIRQKVWVEAQGLLYFTADDGDHGLELWRSDGTAAGTFMVVDLRPGPGSSNPKEMAAFNGRVFFSADDGASGPALWQSDGTPAGTRLVKDTWPSNPSNPQGPALLQAVGRSLFFTAPSPGNGVELWKSDGTARGTAQVADLSPRNASTNVRDAVAFAGRLLFVAVIGNQGQELWISDGTAKGTRKLTAFSSPQPFLGGKLRPGVPLGNRFVFHASETRSGGEWWVTDGTAAGTRLIRDICPGSCSSAPTPDRLPLLVHQGRLFFSGTDGQKGFEPWVTDGTAAGTRLLRDICPGPCGSFPFVPTPLGNRVLFVALTGEDGRDGQEIWRTDGTTAGTVRVSDFASSHPFEHDTSTAVVSGAVLFSGRDGTLGSELWRTDGTRQGTFLVADIEHGDTGGSFPRRFMTLGETLYFLARDETPGWTLWKNDGGTEAGTSRVADIFPHSSTASISVLAPAGAGGPLLFMAILEADAPYLLYRTDGTAAGTYQIDLGEGGRVLPSSFGYKQSETVGGKAFLVVEDEDHGAELWVSDGTPAGTRLVKDVRPGEIGSSPNGLTAFGNRVFFSAMTNANDGFSRLWVSDGTEAGTVLVTDTPLSPRLFTVHGGFLYFFAYSQGADRSLWRTDGTAAGTVRVADVTPGPDLFFESNLLSTGSRLVFWGGFGHPSEEEPGMWVSDGTQTGTRKIAPVLISSFSAFIDPVVLDGIVYFGGRENGRDTNDFLWRSDGTEAGTYPVRTRDGGFAPPPKSLVAAGNRIFFTTHAAGVPLWQSDGTPEGTFRIRELVPGGNGSEELGVAASRVFFSARDPLTGHELWAIAPE
jgi:trimeric autotransporter adhesin